MRIYNPFKKIRKLESELTRVREELNNEQQKKSRKTHDWRVVRRVQTWHYSNV